MNRSPDDPNNEPTQMAGYDYGGNGNYGEPAYYSEYREPTGRQAEWTEPPPPPTPWYLRPVALVGLGVLTAILIALLVWGMVRLVNKEPIPTAPATSSVTSTAPAEEPLAPAPRQAPSDATTDENPPPATESEPPTSTTEAPSTTTTTEPPTTTTAPPTTTEAPTTTAPSTTAGPATPTPGRRPPEIVIPLPGL
ncbi:MULTISPECIES: hypothetical protein [Mycolicibacter]|uniref:Uncharacterized protein n=1 Tax=Mycolicibacter virginiensis TaxID=1795032 RepID=A0A9X7ILT0_9MYCO|nr:MULTISPECIES: hypothetical protein [Mycobacteriaceae]OBJ34531.1 hypothetical protein A5631_04105 [Mycolicibacter heraklionensis]PQM51588.1 hypothetical protein C5U48_14090 [Mycolicibacter virginiensis]ULP47909.1 hypothetical protein MJO54_01690 [Mycolicibacter virginiensis]